jgi:4-hydroxy-tetrahydrodipicolinate synthase
MTIDERKLFAEVAVKVVNGRVPVTIHVSSLAVEDTFMLARHAEDIGADGILAITPYVWAPTAESIHDYFMRLCGSIGIEVISYNSPSYLAGVEITGDLMASLIEKLPNFVGVKEASFNSEKFIEISRTALAMRPDFSMLTGVEFLLPSVPLGGVGCYSAAGSICPNLCLELYDSCVAGDWPKAREVQIKMTRLWHLFKDQYPSSLKGGMVIMGRPVGPTRAPLPTATPERRAYIETQLEDMGILDTEPHGW